MFQKPELQSNSFEQQRATLELSDLLSPLKLCVSRFTATSDSRLQRQTGVNSAPPPPPGTPRPGAVPWVSLLGPLLSPAPSLTARGGGQGRGGEVREVPEEMYAVVGNGSNPMAGNASTEPGGVPGHAQGEEGEVARS